MKKISSVILLVFIISSLVFSCREDFNYETASQPLRFSKDTVMLDTVFSSLRTETYALKVYNRQNIDVIIPRIYLENLHNSQFKINIDGTPGYDFKDIPLRAKDSIFVFIEMAPKPSGNSEALVDEDLIFNTAGHTQKIKLLSLVEDADFFFSENGSKIITEDMTWDNSKSKVIYGDLKFTNNATLTILEGTRVYLHRKANLIIENGGLQIKGSLGKEVIIRGDRHIEKYDSLPGNWNQITLGSKTHSNIDYAVIKGGNNALIVGYDANLKISNTKIFNFAKSGINSIGAIITGTNLVINNCGFSNLSLEYGGTYDFTHCTFSNNRTFNNSTASNVYLTNFYDQLDRIETNSLNATFKNCILWTTGSNSISFNKVENEKFKYKFENNIIKNSNIPDINNNPDFINNTINQDPLFENINYSKNLLYLKPGSPAFEKGNTNYAQIVPLDILGVNRTSKPTIGAYQ